MHELAMDIYNYILVKHTSDYKPLGLTDRKSEGR